MMKEHTIEQVIKPVLSPPPCYRYLRWLAAFWVLALVVGCTKDPSDDDSGSLPTTNACDLIGLGTRTSFTRIINGTECSFGDSPVVFLRIGAAACTGVVIANNAVLTAAHCFANENEPVTVSSGAASNVKGFSSRVILHPERRLDSQQRLVFNDVAIVITRNSLGLPSLPLLVSREPRAGDVISIFGYGQSEVGDPETNVGSIGRLRSGQMVIDSLTPTHIFSTFDGIGSNTCFGDSGGPALFRSGGSVAIVGSTSAGTSTTCAVGDRSNFTRIDAVTITDFVVGQVPSVRLN